MPKPERGERHNGNIRSVRISIKTPDPRAETWEAIASPRRLPLHPGDSVIWTFEGDLPANYQPEIRFVSFRRDDREKPAKGKPPFDRLTANGKQVESDGCCNREGLYGYEVWLTPRKGCKGTAIELEIQPWTIKGGPETVMHDPLPPDIQVRVYRS